MHPVTSALRKSTGAGYNADQVNPGELSAAWSRKLRGRRCEYRTIRGSVFFRKDGDAGKVTDVTEQVARLELEENGNGSCTLIRMDANGAVLWKTTHPSLQEAKWHCEFEYGLPDDKWVAQE